jgi:hypothetical protein
MAYDVDDYFSNPVGNSERSDTFIQEIVSEIISRIPTQGDRARIELVGYCYNHFDFEVYPGDRLTPKQRAAVDAFVASYTVR